MKVKQLIVTAMNITPDEISVLHAIKPQLILVFASITHFQQQIFSPELLNSIPNAQWIGCSTAGEISSKGVSDDSIIITALHFDHPDFKVASTTLLAMENTEHAGQALARQLQADNLNNIIVLGQGVNINGSALIDGMKSIVDERVVISGGLAGDAGQFTRTFILNNHGISQDEIVGIGFYGEHIQLSVGCFGGWQAFGSKRRVTRYQGNILFELDGKPALELYKNYLGDYAKDLPASGLLFPFSMMSAEGQDLGIIRTILGIDEDEGSLILAGDVIEGGYLQLMLASTDALVDGAETAARMVHDHTVTGDSLAILVSCVGRKLLMGGRVDEEVEAVGEVFGEKVTLTGFYSNGEISPFSNTTDCKLHNQTMTITCLSER